MELCNAVFVITGGGSELGAATARVFAEAGAHVAIFDLREDSGQRVATEVGGQYHRVDVTSDAEVREAVAAVVESYGAIHGAVNCAGIGMAAKVLSHHGPHPLDVFVHVIRVNLIGTFNVIRWVANAARENPTNAEGERGVIINTASVAAFEGQIGQAAYAASKGGVASMTLPIARELAAFGIRVSAIAPGLFDTPILGQLPESARASLGAQVPFPPRLGKPEEYGQLARHIVENPMINGEVIRLDGALRMTPR
ncbi:3-hydroxyacyl-CoA dehydrogenase [Alicyclobacillus contaminans]|uniref:3-hydroxyacyl-CoA dehydrogenase n=1 Tax=Alicyclobacillus contaminans TaxID=392016 RepID=UPI0004232ED1|nr:3-hydroxyacyl-CoA dehydrogenase [Alicyclobacillus contaminans]